jgi:hypothetical protein
MVRGDGAILPNQCPAASCELLQALLTVAGLENVITDGMDRYHMVVNDSRCRECFAIEPPASSRIRRQVGGEYLERDEMASRWATSWVGLPSTAFCQNACQEAAEKSPQTWWAAA